MTWFAHYLNQISLIKKFIELSILDLWRITILCLKNNQWWKRFKYKMDSLEPLRLFLSSSKKSIVQSNTCTFTQHWARYYFGRWLVLSTVTYQTWYDVPSCNTLHISIWEQFKDAQRIHWFTCKCQTYN